jgi:hypothetical protein
MKSLTLLPLTVFLAFGKISNAQSLTGNWKGTSLCQVKNSSCHDEIVVYQISKGKDSNSYEVDGAKIIDGKEDHMGILKFSFDPKQRILVLVDSVRQVRWEFKVTGNEMHGTLVSKGTLSRIVDLKKED